MKIAAFLLIFWISIPFRFVNAGEQAEQDCQKLGTNLRGDTLSAKKEAIRQVVQERFGPQSFVADNGVPTELEGGRLNEGITAAQPTERAQQFFAVNKDLFRLENPSKELIVAGGGGSQEEGYTVVFFQSVKGVRVDRTEYRVHMYPNGRIWAVSGIYYPEARQVDTAPSISQERAREIALQNAPPFPQDTLLYRYHMSEVRDLGLIIGNVNGEFRLVWRVFVPRVNREVPDARYWIDAKTGVFLKREDTERE